MLKKLFLALTGILLFGCTIGRGTFTEETVSDDGLEMGDTQGLRYQQALYIEPQSVAKERAVFMKKLRDSGRSPHNKEPLYQIFIDVIGANGILDALHEQWPKCHSEAHALGRVIFQQVKDIGLALRVCSDGCYSGCMHGVLMSALSAAGDPDDPEGHISIGRLKPLLQHLCRENEVMTAAYSPGDCAHGVGHALMYLVAYDVPRALQLCGVFEDTPFIYYCATGAYMEYVEEHDERDAKTRSIFSPCDVYDYPAACMRYKSVHVLSRLRQKTGNRLALMEECKKLIGKYRLGCIHGAANAYMPLLVKGRVTISEICGGGTEDEQEVCIEGAMERMAKYYPERAREVCAELPGSMRQICDRSVQNGMYNVAKDFRLYVRE